MEFIHNVFNNRELAIGLWLIIFVITFSFTKPGKEFVKTTLPIIFCKKFVVFYFIMASVLVSGVWALFRINYWDWSMTKDTVLWVFFVELPVCVKAIESAKNERFFFKMIKENLQIVVVIEFILSFWTFNFWIEFISFPILLICGVFLAIAQYKKHKSVEKIFEKVFLLAGLVLLFTAIINVVKYPALIFNVETLKVFFLPMVLLILNLPVVYALALFNIYEQIFIRLKGKPEEKRKMKWAIILFAKANLKKVYQLQKDIMRVLTISLTAKDIKKNLKRIKAKMDMNVGDNYMRWANHNVFSLMVIVIIAIITLIVCNSEVGLKDILQLNFTMKINRIKEILTYLSVSVIAFSIPLLACAIGLWKRKYEEISNIKKIALIRLLNLIVEQDKLLKISEDPIKDPWEVLFYIAKPAYNIFIESGVVLASYDNLLKDWERESIDTLNLYSNNLIHDIKPECEEFLRLSGNEFADYYKSRIESAPQNEKINTYLSFISTDIGKYKNQIAICIEEFKYLTYKL